MDNAGSSPVSATKRYLYSMKSIKSSINEFNRTPIKLKRYKSWTLRSGIKPGDKVKVTRTASDYEKGWGNQWIKDMDDYVGKIYTVSGSDIGKGFLFDDNFSFNEFRFPYFVLEKQ